MQHNLISYRTMFLLSLFILLLLTACSGTSASTQTVAAADPVVLKPEFSVTTTLIDFDVNQTQINSDEGLTQAILRNCQELSGNICLITDFGGLGAIFSGTNSVYIKDLVALNSLEVFNNLILTNVGDTVVWGPEAEVEGYANQYEFNNSNTIIVSGNIVVDGEIVREEILYSGGNFASSVLITHQRSPYEDFWRAYLNDDRTIEYEPEEAFEIATGR